MSSSWPFTPRRYASPPAAAAASPSSILDRAFFSAFSDCGRGRVGGGGGASGPGALRDASGRVAPRDGVTAKRRRRGRAAVAHFDLANGTEGPVRQPWKGAGSHLGVEGLTKRAGCSGQVCGACGAP